MCNGIYNDTSFESKFITHAEVCMFIFAQRLYKFYIGEHFYILETFLVLCYSISIEDLKDWHHVFIK